MNKRPKRSDTEEDILEMQKAFLAEKANNKSFQPAASVVKMASAPQPSLVVRFKKGAYTGMDIESEEKMAKDENGKELNVIVGDILEKDLCSLSVSKEQAENAAFPKVHRIGVRARTPGKKSLFAQSLENKNAANMDNKREKAKEQNDVAMPMEIDPEFQNQEPTFGDKSFIVEDSTTASEVHKTNLEILGQMKEQDILKERQEILNSIDPSLVEFLARKRKMTVDKLRQAPQPQIVDKVNVPPPIAEEFPEGSPAVKLLKSSAEEQWIHFDVVEKDKLEWMHDVSQTINNIQPGQTFEARFDWKGVLLPYSDDSNNRNKDERELYLHGEEPFRPGYTLQELFRLARSNVTQQRVSAFTAIAGILSIYNQGFYDLCLELPIAKIFFLLRFGLDENTPACIEVVSKGLAYLLYNETDEILLDFIYENTFGFWQPTLEVKTVESEVDDTNSIANLQKKMGNLKMMTPIEEEPQSSGNESKLSMSDFQLAETDLIECLLRTNIIQRIYFIFSTVKPNNSTVSSCLKILIRIARANKNAAAQIVNADSLMTCMVKNFLPSFQDIDMSLVDPPYYDYPQYLALKLCRVLVSQSSSFNQQLRALGIVDRIESYLFTQENLKVHLIKIQIEAFRLLRSIMLVEDNGVLYGKFLPAFRYMINWHFHHVVYEKGGPSLIRQHASALLAAVACGLNNFKAFSSLGSLLADCCCNWFYKAIIHGIDEFSQTTLLTSCLNASSGLINKHTCDQFQDFIHRYLKKFLDSEVFEQFISRLSNTSILLRPKGVTDRRNVFPALPNVGSILVNKQGPQMIIPQTYCAYFVASLSAFIDKCPLPERHLLIESLNRPKNLNYIQNFITSISKETNGVLISNFFAKCELRLIIDLLSFDGFKELIGKTVVLQAAYKLSCVLGADYTRHIEFLFERIIFNVDFLSGIDQEILDTWKCLYMNQVYRQATREACDERSLSRPFTSVPVLRKDWPFSLLEIISEHLTYIRHTPAMSNKERNVIEITIKFTELLEANGIQITSPTEKLMFLMLIFMGPTLQFHEPPVKALLKDYISSFYKSCSDYSFQFDQTFEGKSKFETVYTTFLEQFQAVSYGDDLFSSLLIIPLAQKYDNKWRRMVWFEHAAVLRFLNCDKNMLLGGLDAYLFPIEEEKSLIQCYATAMQTNLLRPNTIPHCIALHHVNNRLKPF